MHSTLPSPAVLPSATARPHLRAVERDETAPVPDLLPPGATLLPAPPHLLPRLPGRPPMVGYLLLVPVGQQQPVLTVSRPAPAAEPPAPKAPQGPIAVDTARRRVEVEGEQLDLTYLEFELLAHLVAHPHRVHTRDQLVSTVWGYGHIGDGRTVDVHIARLRRKLGGHRDRIRTVRRVGYTYAP